MYEKRKAKIFITITIIVILIIIPFLLSAQDLAVRDITETTHDTIDVNPRKVYKAEGGYVNLFTWKFNSDAEITVMYLSDSDLYFIDQCSLLHFRDFFEILERSDDQVLLERGQKGSGFTDLSSKSVDYYLVFASFGSGELEYEVMHYSFYFDLQFVVNIIAFILIMIGVVYLFLQSNELVTEKKNQEKRIKELSGDTTKGKKFSIISSPRYCERCGTFLDSDSRYCHECGKVVEIRKIYQKSLI